MKSFFSPAHCGWLHIITGLSLSKDPEKVKVTRILVDGLPELLPQVL